jgi:hypothetical protein
MIVFQSSAILQPCPSKRFKVPQGRKTERNRPKWEPHLKVAVSNRGLRMNATTGAQLANNEREIQQLPIRDL